MSMLFQNVYLQKGNSFNMPLGIFYVLFTHYYHCTVLFLFNLVKLILSRPSPISVNQCFPAFVNASSCGIRFWKFLLMQLSVLAAKIILFIIFFIFVSIC
ncbi:hypothetical protein ACH5RR_020420 [Cinchona calisaya]|uniref:Uncharacterized protein n=1 Tax=Cinchona calisaya TaxID=153742 RepID=A0ABD2ZEG0_9GENT